MPKPKTDTHWHCRDCGENNTKPHCLKCGSGTLEQIPALPKELSGIRDEADELLIRMAACPGTETCASLATAGRCSRSIYTDLTKLIAAGLVDAEITGIARNGKPIYEYTILRDGIVYAARLTGGSHEDDTQADLMRRGWKEAQTCES